MPGGQRKWPRAPARKQIGVLSANRGAMSITDAIADQRRVTTEKEEFLKNKTIKEISLDDTSVWITLTDDSQVEFLPETEYGNPYDPESGYPIVDVDIQALDEYIR